MKKVFIALGITLAIGATTFAAIAKFSDVSEKDWFYPGVSYVSEHGIMTGYSDGKFGPNDGVNRAQLATVLSRIDAGTISQINAELYAMRQYDTSKLVGSDWKTYKNALVRFPADGVMAQNEASVSYEAVKDTLKVVATDKDYQILATSKDAQYFFVKYIGDQESSNISVYGPFFDNVAKVISGI